MEAMIYRSEKIGVSLTYKNICNGCKFFKHFMGSQDIIGNCDKLEMYIQPYKIPPCVIWSYEVWIL